MLNKIYDPFTLTSHHALPLIKSLPLSKRKTSLIHKIDITSSLHKINRKIF